MTPSPGWPKAVDDVDRIRALPIWKGSVDPEPLHGGITNHNFLVRDRGAKFVVRVGADIPLHGVMRFNELAASRAAAAAGVSPAVRHAEHGLMVIDFVDGATFTAPDVLRELDRAVALVKRAHDEIPRRLRGPALSFNVFHILGDYAATLEEGCHRCAAELTRFLETADALKRAVGPIDLVFGHNDLLPGNFIDDGERLWLIDWDYAGFNSPLFDLGGLVSNAEGDDGDRRRALAAYFGAAPDDALMRRYAAMTAASLLREAMWSMVSELHSNIDFDYRAYTQANLDRFEREFARFQSLGDG